ncbi:pyridoxamine kinase [Sedimentibacter sp. zth1]|uniref:pyridoxamine kinase n=1 Tax=Sedimentibacter sp. zth1 TaxID=2816908 RepID=UPI001A91C387|nr:pyridoxamine kinase [Sedimentibacter sp. zth1]QSX06622.1 pyridoxamine kinase [Sedimentibacter sp. zth1]
MKNIVPTIAAIHDISGYGRCSTTVALPILSALGCQVCPLPTAILSNHTGYKDFFFFDYTDYLEEYYKHWEINNFKFDCMYSGFLGSQKQIEIITDIIERMKKNNNTLIVVDPVMGDHGEVYSTYTKELIEKMNELVKHADIITPNLTEVCILLNIKYESTNLSIETLKDYLYKLSTIGPNTVLITGVKTVDNEFVNVCYDKKENKYYKIPYENIDIKYPGTGDLFTSLFVGYLFKGLKLPEAIEKASKFVTLAVKTTSKYDVDINNGVLFELIMKDLFNENNIYNYLVI